LSKLPIQSGRFQLPNGWKWAVWHGSDDTRKTWEQLGAKVQAKFWARFMEVLAAGGHGRRLPHEKYFEDRGIGKSKLTHPSPGWRVWSFRRGPEYFITHITQKDVHDRDHDKQIDLALVVKGEHIKATGS
jgi:hypothetical protein